MMSRHISIEKPVVTFSAGSCGPSAPPFFLFNKQSCNGHEVICEHSGCHEQFKMLATLGQATLHATSPKQNGDSPFDAGTEALTLLEARAFLVRCLFRCFLAAALRNAHKLDPSVCAMLDIPFAEKSSIGAVKFGRVAKGFTVAFQRGFDVSIIPGIPIEHLILSDETAGALRNVDTYSRNRISNEFKKREYSQAACRSSTT
jgi:hypothetical protein